MTELSNWGRWGGDDERGTVNLITPAIRKAAAALVTEGFSVSLARRLNDTAAVDNPSPFIDKLPAGPAGGQFNTDEFALPVHGFGSTHLDALSHVFYQGRMYNGVPVPSTVTGGRRRLSVEAFGDGIFSRGVIVDIPWLRGVPYLEPGTVDHAGRPRRLGEEEPASGSDLVTSCSSGRADGRCETPAVLGTSPRRRPASTPPRPVVQAARHRHLRIGRRRET